MIGCEAPAVPPATVKQVEELQAAVQRLDPEVVALRHGVPKQTEDELARLGRLLDDESQWPVEPGPRRRSTASAWTPSSGRCRH